MYWLTEFKNGRWGFTIFSGTQVVTDSWSADGFPMARNPESEWERSEVDAVAQVTMKDAEELWHRLDTLVDIA